MEKVKNTLNNNITETLYITLYMKSMESKKSDPILRDAKAVEMTNSISYDFSKYDYAIRSAIGVAVRAKHFDDQIRNFIQISKNPVVVLLGCGLDSRYYRLNECRDNAVFYELDLPEVIEMRRKFMPETENDIYLSSSMFDIDWMDTISQKHKNHQILFVVEGVLMYFPEKLIQQLFYNLSQRFSNAELHFDVVNKWLAKNSDKHDTVKYTNANFVFGLDDDKLIENWGKNLSHHKTYLYSDFPAWKKVGFMQRLFMLLLPKYKYAGRILHYRLG